MFRRRKRDSYHLICHSVITGNWSRHLYLFPCARRQYYVHSEPSLFTHRLILLKREQDLLDSIRRDDHHLQAVTDLNVPLNRAVKGILN